MKHNRRAFLALFLVLFAASPALAPLGAQDVLRGEVRVEIAPFPVFSGFVEARAPLDENTARRQALHMGALFFAAQIYGWAFHYDIGERARGIAEEFELRPLGEIEWGDPRLFVTHAHVEGSVFTAWMDYRPSDIQRQRLNVWSAGNIRPVQGIGRGQLGGPDESTTWFDIQITALEDAARAAVRAMLQANERNRPKQATGFISLQEFPFFWMDSGSLAARARFRVEVREIIPFAVH
ncbi:MAG: hypothetical protein FWD91_00995 [Treponema sp.]|nr:hypothetical protein [Treponema sp.]